MTRTTGRGLKQFMAGAMALLMLSGVAAFAVADEPVAKVVYHVDFADPDRLGATLVSINNMVNTYQESLMEYDVRIVFLGEGIRFLTDDPLKGTPFAEDEKLKAQKKVLMERLTSAREVQDVKLELCNITLTSVNLSQKKLLPGITLVPSGVVRLAELQSKGFAYLKMQ
ncbi:MAG: DsrE family protein [Gammaproteobacteria bacterium]|nr:DsrE family protein [Gammaproteobacteria bacterium]